MRRTSINLPPFLCEVCGLHKRKRKNYSHEQCSRILQQIRRDKEKGAEDEQKRD